MNAAELDRRYVERLRELPFVQGVRPLTPRPGADAALEITTPTGPAAFDLEIVAGPVSKQDIGRWIARSERTPDEPALVAAPYVPRQLARLLVAKDVNFVDLAGNCRLRVGGAYLAVIEGRPALDRPRRELALRAAGYQVVFGLLVEPNLASAPMRTIAAEIGVGKSVVSDTFRTLNQRALVSIGGRKRFLERRALARLWLSGYSAIVRPASLIGRYHVQDRTPHELEQRIEPILNHQPIPWAWGGATAADRLLHHYRGAETVVYLRDPPFDLAKRLRAIPDPDGPLVLMRAPGPLAFRGAERGTVHPLLVYAELLEGDERSRETGTLVLDRYLGDYL